MTKAKQHNQQSIRVESATEMQKLAASIAAKIVTTPPGETATVIALSGDLGAGKTTFSQGLLKALGVRRRVISPTFLLVRPYELSHQNYSRAFHIDCYRLKHAHELRALGFSEMINNPKHLVLIEWPELIEELLPEKILRVTIEHPKKGSVRTVSLS